MPNLACVGRGVLTSDPEKARRLTTIVRFLGYLPEIADESRLIQAVIQAAAVWYDLDARAYRVDSQSRFVLDVWLPGADPLDSPQALDASAVLSASGPVRIASIPELEQLGWRSPHGEVLVLPVTVGETPQWLIVLMGGIEPEMEAAFASICRTLAICLTRLAGRRPAELQERLIRRIQQGGAAQEVAVGLLAELASATSAAEARLEVPGGGEQTWAISAAGAEDARAAEPPLGGDRGERLVLELAAAPGKTLVLQSAESAFTVSQRRIARAGVTVIDAWLAGTRADFTPTGLLSGSAPDRAGFEVRVQEEVARASRFDLQMGLLVLGFLRPPVDPEVSTAAALSEAAREALRASDVTGPLDGDEFGALLLHTGTDGLALVADRVERRLNDLARCGRLPPVRLGTAAFPSSGVSAAALVAEARRDAARRAISMSPAKG